MIPAQSVTDPAREKWESFQPLLLATLNATKGPVLEIGVGYYSTPWLHTICALAGRPLTSVEESEEWLEVFQRHYECEGHAFIGGPYFSLLPKLAEEKWGVIFLDHSPGPRRAQDLALFLQCQSAEFIVVHDYHEAIREAIDPLLTIYPSHVDAKREPPTLLVSCGQLIPTSILSI